MSSTAQNRPMDRIALEHLLAAFAQDRDEAAHRLGATRERLEKYFAWERIPEPDELAWQCLTRVAQKLAAGLQVDNIEAYLYGVARLMLQEARAELARTQKRLAQFPPTPLPDADIEAKAAALEACLAKLNQADRNLILRYYEGETATRIHNRKIIASELNLSLNALRNKALRLRTLLERCFRSRYRR